MASQQQDDRMRSEADAALREHSHLNCDGFESSKVFALTSAILASPKPGGMTRSRLIRNINAIFLFIVHPTTPLDASNPRTKPTKSSSGGALRPALWHVDMRRSGQIGKGQPPTTLLGRKRRADIVVECRDRDLVDLATGKLHPAKLYNGGRLKIKGDLDRALRMATVLSHERSKIFGAPPVPLTDPNFGVQDAHQGSVLNGQADYSDGAPAPFSDVNPPRSRL